MVLFFDGLDLDRSACFLVEEVEFEDLSFLRSDPALVEEVEFEGLSFLRSDPALVVLEDDLVELSLEEVVLGSLVWFLVDEEIGLMTLVWFFFVPDVDDGDVTESVSFFFLRGGGLVSSTSSLISRSFTNSLLTRKCRSKDCVCCSSSSKEVSDEAKVAKKEEQEKRRSNKSTFLKHKYLSGAIISLCEERSQACQYIEKKRGETEREALVTVCLCVYIYECLRVNQREKMETREFTSSVVF